MGRLKFCIKHKGIELLTAFDTANKFGAALKLAGLVTLAGFSIAAGTNDRVLLKAAKYEVTATQVTQGKYVAKAVSPDEIKSTYRSNYRIRTPKEIQIKFSINGGDNEAPAGQNHLLVIDSTKPQTFVFENFPTAATASVQMSAKGYLKADTRVVIRLDMRAVMADMNKLGYYTTFDGHKVTKDDFRGVYVAGNTLPLSWDFQTLPEKPQFALHDSDNSGIYKGTIFFSKVQFPGHSSPRVRDWKLAKNIAAFPSYTSGSVLSEALYNKSLEEMLEDVRPDGAFMAGAMWPGVWTRDVSYSGFLSLAIINPDAVKASLLKKVRNDRIIQDTGTGGSWPVSSDRMVWTLAAWEVYKVTGDEAWLKKAYEIAGNSAMDDMHTLEDPATGLFHGESSFLDWREQTYPRWMDPKDIFMSEDLGTNAVHYETYRILAKMADALRKSPEKYLETARRIKEGINKYLWMPKKGYYGQYLYGRNYQTLSPRSESLGESLCVLFGIADRARAAEVIRKTPVTQFGITCIYPQIPGISPYHNNAVWPFVESYWAWASSEANNMASVSRAIGAVYRAASFFLTNKENMVASTGDYLGTQINSDRQLWSVAGDLSIVYRVLFGLRFHRQSLSFSPCVPVGFGKMLRLDNLFYRKAVLSISINGWGNRIASVSLDGHRVSGDAIPANLVGKHSVEIVMGGERGGSSGINLVPVMFSPATPRASLDGSKLKWNYVDGAVSYSICRNGKEVAKTGLNHYEISVAKGYSEYQVMAVGRNGLESFLSTPLVIDKGDPSIVVQAESNASGVEQKYPGYTGSGYISLDLRNPDSPEYKVNIKSGGLYAIIVRYANGEGPINTDNKCAIRTLYVDHHADGPVVMPQRGEGVWSDWGYSNVNHISLSPGVHLLSISFDKHDNNMNGNTNTALVDAIRLTMISKR